MDTPIVVTPQEIINILLATCGAIITIAGAVTIILRVVAKLKAPEQKQNDRIEAVELKIKGVEEKLEVYKSQFRSDDLRMLKMEQSMKESNKIIIEGLQALTQHAIDGNNVEELKAAKRRLDDYLIDKI